MYQFSVATVLLCYGVFVRFVHVLGVPWFDRLTRSICIHRARTVRVYEAIIVANSCAAGVSGIAARCSRQTFCSTAFSRTGIDVSVPDNGPRFTTTDDSSDRQSVAPTRCNASYNPSTVAMIVGGGKPWLSNRWFKRLTCGSSVRFGEGVAAHVQSTSSASDVAPAFG